MRRMTPPPRARPLKRRTVLKAGLAWSAFSVASPFPIHARGEEPVKMGMVEPLSGVYAIPTFPNVPRLEIALINLRFYRAKL